MVMEIINKIDIMICHTYPYPEYMFRLLIHRKRYKHDEIRNTIDDSSGCIINQKRGWIQIVNENDVIHAMNSWYDYKSCPIIYNSYPPMFD